MSGLCSFNQIFVWKCTFSLVAYYFCCQLSETLGRDAHYFLLLHWFFHSLFYYIAHLAVFLSFYSNIFNICSTFFNFWPQSGLQRKFFCLLYRQWHIQHSFSEGEKKIFWSDENIGTIKDHQVIFCLWDCQRWISSSSNLSQEIFIIHVIIKEIMGRELSIASKLPFLSSLVENLCSAPGTIVRRSPNPFLLSYYLRTQCSFFHEDYWMRSADAGLHQSHDYCTWNSFLNLVWIEMKTKKMFKSWTSTLALS